MQVSQITELDTHAVIGGGKAQAFSMSDSAEFFTVLSDTLYRDKKRAVVREVVCNAWDAHLTAGCTDIPVEITLTDNELMIRDFGPGIAADRIVPIYCVYGASTKVNDEGQTGGFGLGSKAPFAYSDHFTVTSCHGGSRAVYAISRGGVATDGKPDIRTMINVPTTETGITVSVPIHSEEDCDEFERIIRSVVKEGGIYARLNGDDLDRLDYSDAAKLGFAAVIPAFDTMRESRVYVLYGTVLYPVSTTDAEVSAAVDDAVRNLPSSWRLLLVAPPSSLGVTPSREALSYSSRTTETILELLGRARRLIKVRIPRARCEFMNAIAARVKERAFATHALGHEVSEAIRCLREGLKHPGFVADPYRIAQIIALEKLVRETTSLLFGAELYRRAAHRFPAKRALYRNIAKEIRYGTEKGRRAVIRRFNTRLFLRLAGRLGVLEHLRVWTGNRLMQPIEAFKDELLDADTLLIAPNQRQAIAYFRDKYKDLDYYAGRARVALVLPRASDDQLRQIRALATQYKIDVTALEFAKPKRKASPTHKGFYALEKVALSRDGYTLRIGESPTLETADIYLRIRGGVEKLEFPERLGRVRTDLQALYPNAALVMTAAQEAKLKAQGARALANVALEEFASLSASREGQYALLMASGQIINGRAHHLVSNLGDSLRDLVRDDLEMAQILFPTATKLGTGAERLMRLRPVLRRLAHSDHIAALESVEKPALERARKAFKHLLVEREEVEQRFGHLRLIRHLYMAPIKQERDHLRQVLSVLNRPRIAATLKPQKEVA